MASRPEGNCLANQHEPKNKEPRTFKSRRWGGAVLFTLALPFAETPLAVASLNSSPRAAAYVGRYEIPKVAPSTTIFQRLETPTSSTTLPKRKETTTTKPTPRPSSNTGADESWTGLASYYSRAGCLGCSPDRTMANGKPLDDNALTVAFNRAALGTLLEIKNTATGKTVKATVTDTGGFEQLPIPKIVDLTPATRDAISCDVPCKVTITRA